jgi:hypothetical protein
VKFLPCWLRQGRSRKAPDLLLELVRFAG